MDESTRLRTAAIFGSMGHPARIAILELLAEDELSVGEISAALSLGQSSTSQHLAALLRSGVLTMTPHGTKRLYRVRGPRIAKVLELIRQFCDIQGLHGEPTEDEEDL